MTTEELFVRSTAPVFDQIFSKPWAEEYVRSGSYLLRLCFSRQSLADEFLPSFQRAAAGPPDLQIGFLTSKETDLSSLVPTPALEYRALADKRWFAMWQPGEQPMLYVLDRLCNRALIWLAADAAPDWIASRPALPIMYAFSIDTPWVALHAAAVGRDERILLLAGEGRVGKTTAAIACASAGWDYAGDDYVYANTLGGLVEPLYCSARLRADMAQAFPALVTATTGVSRSDGELRHELRLGSELGPQRLRGGKIAAILLLRRRGAERPVFSPARRFDAISALYTSMMLSQLGWSDVMVKKITTVIGLAPVFFADTGMAPAAIPDAFAEFLGKL